MNKALMPLSRNELQLQFVDGAVHKLAAALSSHEAPPVHQHEHQSLTTALGRILQHFGCAVDEVSLAVASRRGDAETVIRTVCEQNHLHVREIELKANEKRTFGTPVLAFRGHDAVALMPRTWRRWSEEGAGHPAAPLEPRGFVFYRTAGTEPLALGQFWRLVLAAESKRDLAFAVLCGTLAAALSAASVYLMQSLVEWALPEGDRRSLALLTSGWLVVALAAANLRLARALLLTRIGTRTDVATEAALVARTLGLPVSELKGWGAGDLSERIRNACEFGKAAYGTATDVALALTCVIAYTAMLATSSLRAAFAILGVLLLRTLVTGAGLAAIYSDGRRHAAARARMSARLFELLSSISRIKVASAEARAFYQWAIGFAKVRRAGYRTSLFSGAMTASEGLFDVAGTLVLYAMCCGDGPLGAGTFIVAVACLGGLQAAYSEGARGMMRLLPLLPKAQGVQRILSARPEVRSLSLTPTTLEGGVSLRQVTFHYADDDVRILDNVSLDIESGQFVAIVGPSGCGKSTLIKLILGFHAPTSGSVLLDGKDLANLDLRSVRRQIGAVLQNSELLPSSILFNIVGTTKQTIDDAWLAARRASIADDIEQMPMKMFTMLSDRAVTISGGQKQRILIARALVREPKLVIFDEATSALDNKAQASVVDSLRQMDCTKICIAHRLSTVVHADRIIVMNKGTIVQQGTFESLMKEDGLFRTLASDQLEPPR